MAKKQDLSQAERTKTLLDLAAFKKLYAFISANFGPIRSEVEKEELIKTTTFIELLLAAR